MKIVSTLLLLLAFSNSAIADNKKFNEIRKIQREFLNLGKDLNNADINIQDIASKISLVDRIYFNYLRIDKYISILRYKYVFIDSCDRIGKEMIDDDLKNEEKYLLEDFDAELNNIKKFNANDPLLKYINEKFAKLLENAKYSVIKKD